ncbi:MAG TPA: NAD(P)-dependent alcohol dehydrogenase [Trebonia sp.]|jgi:NADPH:quinone reductase-like Zn-dependent oxidoreductase
MEVMRAVQFDAYGGPEVLQVRSVPRPVPGRGEVLVRVQASTVNGHDLLTRSGSLRILTGRRFPMGVGIDFAGVVAGRGDGVSIGMGAPVWGSLRAMTRHVTGTLAEYVAVGADRVAPMPPGLSPAEAASLVVPGSTAVRALRRSAGLKAGERLLVRGAGGGAGLAMVQLGVALGAAVTTLSAERDFERLRSYGVKCTLDYRTRTAGDLDRFDVIVDTVGGQLLAYRRKLAPGGRMVAIAAGSPGEFAAAIASVVFGPRRLRAFSDDPRTRDLNVVKDLIEIGALRPVLGPRYTLDCVADAHRSLAAGGCTGKRVMEIIAS